MIKFSIVMPSYLGAYRYAAKNREQKLIRAIESVREQSYINWELLIIADGCQQTVKLVKPYLDGRIKLFSIPKQRLWSGSVRNTGLLRADGDWIVYLDIDDMFGEDHLKIIESEIDKEDWVWFNDRSWDEENEQFNEHGCSLERGYCGTSNVAHKSGLAGWEKKNNYYQDWRFILNLKIASNNYKKITTPQYLVCHVPGKMDYDGNSKKLGWDI